MITSGEFNTKYKPYLEDRHYGLAIEYPEVVELLDNIFSEVLIHVPDFSYSQIKLKFGTCCFYCSLGFNSEIVRMVEQRITEMCAKASATEPNRTRLVVSFEKSS